MKNKHATLFAVFVILAFVVVVNGKEWRGITPLHSTRTDVERLLGDSSSKKQLTTYQTEKEAVSVLYASGPPCGSDAASEWHVPKDTVVSITVSPKIRLLLSDLSIDFAKFDKIPGIHRPNIISYVDDEDGEAIEVFHDEVASISYFAAASDSRLKCEPNERRSSVTKAKKTRGQRRVRVKRRRRG